MNAKTDRTAMIDRMIEQGLTHPLYFLTSEDGIGGARLLRFCYQTAEKRDRKAKAAERDGCVVLTREQYDALKASGQVK